jgi:hypothetical protein
MVPGLGEEGEAADAGSGLLEKFFSLFRGKPRPQPFTANATVSDLASVGRDSIDEAGKFVPTVSKQRDMAGLTDQQLIDSTLNPTEFEITGTPITIDSTGTYLFEGNHRAEELLLRANSPLHPGITSDTLIYIQNFSR